MNTDNGHMAISVSYKYVRDIKPVLLNYMYIYCACICISKII